MDNSGHIEQDEMVLAIEDLKLIVPDLDDFSVLDIESAYEKLDRDYSGSISYTHFLIGTLDPTLINDPKQIECLFKELDCFNADFLTKESVQIAM